MQEVFTYYAQIFVGLREGYGDRVHNLDDVRTICKEYVDKVGLCVTNRVYLYRFRRAGGNNWHNQLSTFSIYSRNHKRTCNEHCNKTSRGIKARTDFNPVSRQDSDD